MNVAEAIRDSLYNGFLDDNYESLDIYDPKLLVNDYRSGMKVLSSIENELNNCQEFMFSVAFITYSGVISLISILEKLREKGIKGKIVTSQYQNFTEPRALKRLLDFENIELKIVTEENLHAKGYIFKKIDGSYSFIVGSSNLTQNALSYNKEWNIKLSTLEGGALFKNLLLEYNYTFDNAKTVDESWIEQYEQIYGQLKVARKKVTNNQLAEVINFNRINPNLMQIEALKSLEELREQGENKALLISATGTGKTYLSAFDVAKYGAKKFLFIVHRENIAKAAMESFKKVIGYDLKCGFLGGNHKDIDKDYVFAMIQTLSKDDVLQLFEKDRFDYIVVDEVHRAGASSYKKVIDYFEPKFLLGMTASPERTDGINIFEIFNYNIAYEIRLQKAMEENMLCPFHYFGITDIDENENYNLDDFKYIVSEERIEHVISKINFYGYSGDRVKGLIFCSRNQEAKMLSEGFNRRGYRTLALSGEDSEAEREKAIERLEQNVNDSLALDYVFTVDIFNEGVDIPSINQVVMLRPTESAIIFVQQLGRGLRKNLEKEFVVVLDFIGNYSKNFLIPIALSGDKSYNKDNIRRFLQEGSRIIPGCSTINFDAISKKRIYEAIDSANFSDVKLIKEAYINLKNKLGRIPKLMDFELYGELDVQRIFDNTRLGSYHKFLKLYEKDEYNVELTETEELIIEFISKKLANGKRVHELELLKMLLMYGTKVIKSTKACLMEKHGIELNENGIDNLVNIMTNNFISGSAKNTYSDCIFIEKELDDYKITNKFKTMLQDEIFYDMVLELVEFGLYKHEKLYKLQYKDTGFTLYGKYTYEDVSRILNWEVNPVPLNIGGYKYDVKTRTFPVFINYKKEEDISATIAYEDRFINPANIIALSKVGRTPESADVKTIYNARELGVKILLFVRKNKDDNTSKEFYFLGDIEAVGLPKPIVMRDTNKNAVEITYRLDTPVRDELYEYLMD